MAAGTSYAGGAGGAGVGLSTLKIYLASPIAPGGKAYDVKKTPIPMVCRIQPHTYSRRYVLVIAHEAGQIIQTAGNVRVLSSFFAGIFLGAKDVVKRFPHPATCVLRSHRISRRDIAFESQGRRWVRDRDVVIKTHVATIIVTTSDFFELVARLRPTALATVTFDDNGGTGKISAVRAKKGSLITLNSGSGVTYPHHVFVGWSLRGSPPALALEYKVTTNVVLKAIWRKSS